MATLSAPAERDISPIPVLFGPRPGIGWILFAVFSASTLALLLLADREAPPHPVTWVVGCGLVLAGAAVFLPGGQRLSSRWAWIAAALAGLASVAPFWQASDEVSGYAPWYVRTATFVFAALILRARPLQGWLGAALSYALLTGWGLGAGEPFAVWGGVILRQVATVIAISGFALLVARAGRAIAAHRAEERARIEATEHRTAGVARWRVELAGIRELVDGTLGRISKGDESDQLQSEAALLAAELRDRLRGRRLAGARVAAAARDARRRGVDVVLLDDLTAGDADVAPDDLAWVAGQLTVARGPRVTVRVGRDETGRAVLTVVSGRGGDRIESRPLVVTARA